MAPTVPSTDAPDRAHGSCAVTVRKLQTTLSRLEAVLFMTDHAVERLDGYGWSQEDERLDRGRLTSLVEVCSSLVADAQRNAEIIEVASLGKQESR